MSWSAPLRLPASSLPSLLYGGDSRYWPRDIIRRRRARPHQAKLRYPRAGAMLDCAWPYVNRFTQAWQKRLTILDQTKKSQNLIDADSELTHVSESSLQVTSAVSA